MRPARRPGNESEIEREVVLDPPSIRRWILLAAVVTLAVGAWALSTLPLIPAVLAAAIAPLFLGLLVRRGGLSDALPLVIAIVLLDGVAIVFGATLRTGPAWAVLIPSAGVGAMSGRMRGRAWVALAASAWAATVAGTILAITVGPAAAALEIRTPIEFVVAVMAVSGTGLTLLWRAGQLQARAVDAAREAVARSTASRVELARTTEALRAMLDASPVPIQAFAPDRTVVAWNPASERLFGWKADEVIGRPLPAGMIPADERAAAEDRLRRTLDGEIIRGDPARRIARAGHDVTVEIHAAAMRDAAGTPIGIAGLMVDVSERTALEEERRAAEARYRSLFDLAPDAIFVYDASLAIVDANAAAARLLRRAAGEILGRSMSEFLVPSDHALDAPPSDDSLARTLRGGALTELLLRTPDGGRATIEINATARADGTFQAVARDLTERIRLDQERRRLAAAVEHAGDTVIVSDEAGVILYVNPAWERVTGHAAADVLGRTAASVLRIGTQDAEQYAALDEAWARGEQWSGRIVGRTSDDRGFQQELTISPIRDAQGTVTGHVHVGHDLTLELELEARLRQTTKMEAVGQLAGGVAHDFNNMLTAIRGFADLARRSLSSADAPARDDLVQVIETADRAARLTRQLLTFARRTVLEPRVVDPAEVLAAMAPMLGRLLGAHIELAIEPRPDSGLIRVDPVQLEQAVLNLAVNASDAMPEGGRLTIRIAGVEVDREFAARHPGAPGGRYVAITVRDTGVGMDEETREHIFEPFFTTKEPGKGTGMGLATVFGAVSMSGGAIEVTSAVGEGSCFELYFPRVSEAAPVAGDDGAGGHLPGGSETILLVEDDPSVRRFARRSLEALGYRVLEAGDGVEALDLVAAHVGPLDLLVSDITMPRMQGTELARRLSSCRPDLGILLVSGFAERAAGGTEPAAGHPFLAKPYTQATLARAVREVLAAKA